jgi:predicted nucleic acid-binding protein
MGRRGGEDQRELIQQHIVSDSSPLISMERIGRMDLFVELFGNVIVPSAVV